MDNSCREILVWVSVKEKSRSGKQHLFENFNLVILMMAILMKMIFTFSILAQVSPGSGKKCTSSSDCPSIQTCLSGSCHEEYHPEPCGQRSDCLRSQYGYECVQGRCGCTSTNQDCPAGNFCTRKRCLLTGKY